MAATDISYGAAVKLRGSLNDLLTKTQTAATSVMAALATITGSTQLAAQASAAASSSKTYAASSAAAAAASASTIATAATVAQTKVDAAAASAASAATSATSAGGSATAAAGSLATLNASKGAPGGVAALDLSSKLLSANFDFASVNTATAGTDTAKPVNSAGVGAAIAALAASIASTLAGKLAASALGVANGVGSLDSAGKQPITQTPTGVSVADPGTGKLEALLPIQTLPGASRTFVAADLYKETRRSNGGVAMTDTFPASNLTGLANGTMMQVNNVDGTASLTITAGSGTTVNGGATAVIGPGRSTKWVYDAPAANWRTTMNSLSAVLSSQVGAASGVAGLDAGQAVPLANLRIRRAQFLKALEASGAGRNAALRDAIPADVGNSTYIAYAHDWVVEPGGTLAAFVQATFSLSNTQMTALFASAAAQAN